jgi:hypothetical protein
LLIDQRSWFECCHSSGGTIYTLLREAHE